MSDSGLLTSDGPNQAGASSGPQWGIFDQDLQPVIIGDSCLIVDFRKDYRISDYPVAPGGFASYNKVATPYDFKVTFTKGGSSSDRQNFLSVVDAICASLDLYNATTPDATYQNANAVHYDYRRTSEKGVSLLTVNIFMEEVRQTASSTFSTTSPTSSQPLPNAKAAQSVGQVQDGIVQPSAATPSQQALVLPLSPLSQQLLH